MDKRLKDYYDGLFSPEEESEVQKWHALHGKDESVSDSLRELFDGEEKRSGEQTLMYKRIAPEKKSIWRSSLMAACIAGLLAVAVLRRLRISSGRRMLRCSSRKWNGANIKSLPEKIIVWCCLTVRRFG